MAKKISDPFPAVVCQKLRNLVAARKRAEVKRKDLFDTRDHLSDEVANLGLGENTKRERVLAEYGQAVMDLQRYERAIKAIKNDIDEAIENADDAKLFSDDGPDVDFDEYIKDRPPSAKAHDAPVGGPSATEPARGPRSRSSDDDDPTPGVDQHLRVSVNELGMRDDLKTACVIAGRDHVSSLVMIVDGPDELATMANVLNVSERDAKTVIRAVKQYRQEHRDAMRKAETGT